jgi:EAL domain-containing protein (putative c-di-GMP-specific phosphodiesterase class I)
MHDYAGASARGDRRTACSWKSVTLSANQRQHYPLDNDERRFARQWTAMYVAKQSAKIVYMFTIPRWIGALSSPHQLSIRAALQNEQFILHYQPKVNLRTCQLVGVEALIRWNHPEQGLLSPAKFLPLIENTDLDIAVGEWVIATALRQLDAWQANGLSTQISVNISAYHLESPDFVKKLQEQLARYPNISVNHLQIEVLETVALADVAKVRHIIEDCKKFGGSFALDDLVLDVIPAYLSSLPIDTLQN